MKRVIKKLDELSLERISGGLEWNMASAYVSLGTVPVILGCSIAGLVCQCRGKKYRNKGDEVRAQKSETAGRVLTDVAIGTSAVGLAGLIGAFTLPEKEIFAEKD